MRGQDSAQRVREQAAQMAQGYGDSVREKAAT